MHGHAWITIAIWISLNAAFFLSDHLRAMGRMPLWTGMAINSLVGCVAFSVVHDSIHRAFSSNTRFDDWIGQLALLLVAPYVYPSAGA